MNNEWKLVPHSAYPGMVVIEGAPFPLTVVLDAFDITLDDKYHRLEAAKKMAAAECMYLALENLENDDGSIPERIWCLVQRALEKAREGV